jgi:hypothetical protein
VSGCVTLVSCYVLRRKRSGSASDEDDALAACEYQVWIISQVYCGPDAAYIPAVVARAAAGDNAAEVLSERLRKAVAEAAADRTMAAVWRSAGFTRQQALDLVADLPDTLRGRAGTAVGNLAALAGVPTPVAVFSGEVAAAFMLEPVLRPVTQALHGLEVVGIVIALATGQPHLSILCAKPLLHDQVGSGLADVFERAMRPEEAASEDDAADTVTADTAQAELAGEPGVAARTRQGPQEHEQGSARQILLDTCRDDDPSLLGGSADQDDALTSHQPNGPAASAL